MRAIPMCRQRRFAALKTKSTALALILAAALLVLAPLRLFGGGIEFYLDNAALVEVGEYDYLSIDVLASSPQAGQRLGTGIVQLNYDPQAFGYNVKTSGNLILGRGELLTTSPFPFYNLIPNDNSPTRLAVTFEYLFTPGGGSLLGSQPQRLLNLKIKVAELGHYSGLSFQPPLMSNQQYLDDNATLFSPVVATDTANLMLPPQPQGLTLSASGGELVLAWETWPGCTYNVYSADRPDPAAWQTEAEGIAGPSWAAPPSAQRRFFRVVALGNQGE